MAEAHQAVAFQFAVTDEGITFHIDRGAVRASLGAIWRLFLTRCYGTLRTIHKGIFPATPLSLLALSGGMFGLYAMGWYSDPTLGLLPYNLSPTWHVSILIVESLFLWTLLSRVQQYTLKFLLFYKGWMFDTRGQRSWKTKVFGVLVKLVAGTSNPILESYQRSLPRLPVPSIEDTCNRYLESVRPLYTDEEFNAKKALVAEFKKGPANKLQRYLIFKSWFASNYVTDWWEKYVYHGWRGSVTINSNYYACDVLGVLINSKRIPRCAVYIYAAMKLKSEIENETLKPLIINNLIPLCSSQYRRLFGTCRIPGESEDTLYHASPEESRHIVCYRLGRWYKIPLYFKNKLLRPIDIQWQIQQIFDDPDTAVTPGEEHLAALTSAERPFWADVRQRFFSTGVNKKYMEDIEKAAFVVNLDEGNPSLSLCGDNTSELLSKYCSELLHGNGYKFWFDKSFSTIFYSSGRLGINAEHSWADAPIVGHMLEYICNLEEKRASEFYGPDGYCNGELNKLTPKPLRMKWELSEACQEKIDIAYTNAKLAVEDVDLCVIQHDIFGKGIIKKCRISPDAFIQMALQLAYYRDSGSFCLTYEASMTRLYREGRTETVRSCTVEAAEFVKAMCDPTNYTREDCKKLLKIATDRHVLAYKNAMIGKGIDRHLFCLYVVSRGKNISSPFLSSVIKEPWKLSTSQTPTQQTGRVDFHKNPDQISCGGGFGPVTKDGYGVSYIIPGDYVIYFHVSSFKSSPHTDSKRFASTIKSCLLDMIKLFDIVLTPEDGLQYKPRSSQ